MNVTELKQVVKEYIADERLDTAFLTLEEYVGKDSRIFDELIIAKSRLSRQKIQDRNGTLDFEQVELYNNAVRTDLIKIVNDLTEADINSPHRGKPLGSILNENKALKERLKELEPNEKRAQKYQQRSFFELGGTSRRSIEFEKQMNQLLRFLHAVVDTTKDQENFIFAVLSGLVTSLRKGLIPEGRNILYLDTDFYPEILKLAMEKDHIYAIADLTDETEKIWDTIPDGEATAVKERTFLLPWNEFFHPQYLSKFYDLAKLHQDFYDIKFSHIPLVSIGREEFRDAIGNDLMVALNSNVVCYYVLKGDRKLLKVIFDPVIADKAMKEYEWITRDAIRFSKEKFGSFHELRENWIQINNFGVWVWKNKPVEDRGPKYVNYYDIHIRCWIWKYEELIINTIRALKSEILTRVEDGSTVQKKILEIGYGTGAVSIPAIHWISQLNKSFELKSADAKVRYFGIDREGKLMKDILYSKLSGQIEPHRFWKGIAWDDIPESLHTVRFDIIVLSLVLHDIITDDPLAKFESFIANSIEYLCDNGVIIITDIFHTLDPRRKEEEVVFWKNEMRQIGLSEAQIDTFFKYNMDMIDTIHREDAKDIVERYGLTLDVRNIPVVYGTISPFKIMMIRKGST